MAALKFFFEALFLAAIFILQALCEPQGSKGVTSRFVRKLQDSGDLPETSEWFITFDATLNLPEQVHLTQGDYIGQTTTVSWVTWANSSGNIVQYGKSKDSYTSSVQSDVTTYTYGDYTSGFIHHAKLEGLDYGTTYFYKVGDGSSSREFSFTTPPEVGPDAAHVFGITADLGQTINSAQTVAHYTRSGGQTMLFVGDMSYADRYRSNSQVRWDIWLRLLENSTAFQSWMWVAGDHEIEAKGNSGETEKFKAFNKRFPVPYQASGSTSSLYYAFKRASAHFIAISYYDDYSQGSTQYQWLQTELSKVDRSTTPWLIILEHVPWYNSNTHHYQQGDEMRSVLEPLIVNAKADIFFAGHVHAYERTFRASALNCSGGCSDENAPVYINIGDGGNSEGLVGSFVSPQPSYSAFREASYGFATLDIRNRTHALYNWHRNDDGDAVVADSTWIINRVSS
ncbi:hypothetical protein SELMODRAFT_97551 [Selaginella moellendorffii]|uniref:Purple acid phosphatase n=1 Tax=Selaginella moellendorffii TaxID=88036 RepID=D8RMJ0_SELML|nr:purple acid phosphatase 2 [Selaginella moellendorffii]EFJ26347.1 hypothetical protein SELMODRAFT_97551 [Selaginella moellendorffii]|eukprot:XP_002972261.1 purple acid phosphatase 2 [Selaginella moellendorffii]